MAVVRLRAPLSELAGRKRELELDGCDRRRGAAGARARAPRREGLDPRRARRDPRAHQRLREQGVRTGGHCGRRRATGCTCSPRSREDENDAASGRDEEGPVRARGRRRWAVRGHLARVRRRARRVRDARPAHRARLRMRDLRVLRAEGLLHRRSRRRSGSRRPASSFPRTRRSRSSGSGRSSRPRKTGTSTRAARRASSSRATTAARPGSSTRRSGSSRRGPTGAPAQAACACTRSRRGPGTRRGSRSRSRRSASGSPTTAARPGGTATRASTRATCRRRRARTRSRSASTTCTARRSEPERLFMQFHGGVYRSDDAGESWTVDRRRPAVRLRLPDGDRPGRPGQRLRHPARRGPGPHDARGSRPRLRDARCRRDVDRARRRPAVRGRVPHDPPPGVLPRGIGRGRWGSTSGRRPATSSARATRGSLVHGRDEPAAGALGARRLAVVGVRRRSRASGTSRSDPRRIVLRPVSRGRGFDPGREIRTDTRVSPSRCEAYSPCPVYFFDRRSICVVGAVLDERRRPGDRDPAVRIGRIHDDERHAWVGVEIARLRARPGGVERDTVVVDVDPYDGRVR